MFQIGVKSETNGALVTEPAELDRHTLLVLQRAVKRKARKARFPAIQDGERILYCIRCLRGSHEVKRMLYDPFFTVCDECVDNLAIFLKHLRDKDLASA